MGAVLHGQVALVRARRSGPSHEQALRRRMGRVLAIEHGALMVAILAGLTLMWLHGWRLGYPRWLSIKLGLVAFLVVPLEGMHAWVNHVWIARALPAAGGGPARPRDLERGIGMDDMLRTLAALLLGAALPVIVWLSVRRPS